MRHVISSECLVCLFDSRSCLACWSCDRDGLLTMHNNTCEPLFSTSAKFQFAPTKPIRLDQTGNSWDPLLESVLLESIDPNSAGHVPRPPSPGGLSRGEGDRRWNN